MNLNSVSFPTRKNEKRKWKSNFVFSLQRKTKNENKIWVWFSYAIENRLALRYTDYCSIIVLVLGNSSIYSPHINHSGQDILTKISYQAPIFLSGLEARLNKSNNTNPVSADCRPGKKCRLGAKRRLQTADWIRNADWEFVLFFRLILDNMSSYNLPSVTQALFRYHLSRLFALLWNIPCLFLDHNRSYYNFKLLRENLLIFPCGSYSEHIYS